MGAIAVRAFAIGAFGIGRLAIRRLSVESAKIPGDDGKIDALTSILVRSGEEEQ